MQLLTIAHRGASAEAPENTMQAFKLAQQQGAQVLEFDVRPTADGTVVVFHDATTERWNGRPDPISELTLAQVQQLDIGGAPVPTLVQVCAWARTTNLALNVEIKEPQIEAQVAQILREHELVERVIISSFNLGVLERMRSVAPEIRIGVLMGTESWSPEVQLSETWPLPALRRLDAHAWHPSWQIPLLDQIIPRVREAGYAVYVWTVDDPAVMRKLLTIGVDGIITNRPTQLLEVQASWADKQRSK